MELRADGLRLDWQYKHYKGDIYYIAGFGSQTTAPDQEVVIYRTSDSSKTWIRPVAEFLEEVINDNGATVKRFTELPAKERVHIEYPPNWYQDSVKAKAAKKAALAAEKSKSAIEQSNSVEYIESAS